VMAIYANENGQGMAFEPLLGASAQAPAPAPKAEEPAPPSLSAVPSSPSLAPAPAPRSEDDKGPDDGGDGAPKGGRPTLTRIK
jgi:stringent starvation protein B